jgi:hypothetical protein
VSRRDEPAAKELIVAVTTDDRSRRRTDDRFQPIPRCCEAHTDWETLARHLVDSFPQASLRDVAQELRVAKDVIELCDLGDDALQVAELIARHRLMLSTGAIDDVARLDPQSHDRQCRVATPAEFD